MLESVKKVIKEFLLENYCLNKNAINARIEIEIIKEKGICWIKSCCLYASMWELFEN